MTAEQVDYTNKATVTIGLVDGDGIGPIIMEQAVRALEALLADEIARGSIALRRIRGLTLENRMACNQAVPDDVLAEILTCDVLLKGPTTTPMGGGLESANVKLRRALDLYANVRPVTIPERGHRLDVLPREHGGRICPRQPRRGAARHGRGLQGHDRPRHAPHRPRGV